MHRVTFKGLEEWYKSEFEKLGWIIITNDMNKMTHYIMTIDNLLKKLNETANELSDPDCIRDITVMIENTTKLRQIISQLFGF